MLNDMMITAKMQAAREVKGMAVDFFKTMKQA